MKLLNLERDYKTYLYFLNAEGSVCRRAKKGINPTTPNGEVVVYHAVERDNNYLYFIDKEGDVARVRRAVRERKKTEKR